MRRDMFLFGLGIFSIWITFRMWLEWLLREPIVPAGRRRKFWMGSRPNMKHLSLNKKIFFFCIVNGTSLEDKVVVPECQAGCFAYKAGSPAFLSSATCTSMTPTCDVLPQRSDSLLRLLMELWVQLGIPEIDVYVFMDSAILLPCYCPRADAIYFPQLIIGVESRSLSTFQLQNKERNPWQTM